MLLPELLSHSKSNASFFLSDAFMYPGVHSFFLSDGFMYPGVQL